MINDVVVVCSLEEPRTNSSSVEQNHQNRHLKPLAMMRTENSKTFDIQIFYLFLKSI